MVRSLAAGAVLWGAVWAAATAQTLPDAGPTEPAAVAAQAQIGASLTEQIQAIVSAPAVSRAHWGVAVTAMDGTPLAGVHEGELFQPASNAKLYTTAAAMALLGPERTFTTRVTYAPPGAHGVVRGDLVLWGAGDGNLNAVDFPYVEHREATAAPAVGSVAAPYPLRYLAEFADRIAAAGVREIRGRVIGDDTVFPWEPYAEDWAIDDMVWGFGAPVSGLTVADNELKLTVRPGWRPGAAASAVLGQGAPAQTAAARTAPGVEPGSGFYTLAAAVVTAPAGGEATVQIDRAVGSNAVRVFGTIPVRHEPIASHIAISDPAAFAAMALRQMLVERGVRVDGAAAPRHRIVNDDRSFLAESRAPLTLASRVAAPEPPCGAACPVVLEHVSPTVGEDVVYTNKVSQNLHAELLLHQLAKAYGDEASTAQGVRVVRQFLLNAGLDPEDFVFYDGSGLSGHDLVTPRATARLLQYAATEPWFGQWEASLPVGGMDGSLANRFRQPSLQGHVFAKTGTLGEARALSGYLRCASGRTVIFSIMVGDFVPGTGAIRESLDRIVSAIAAAE